jgi:hypothetical protein
MERLEKGDQRRGLRRIQILSIRGHVAAPLNHLADELIRRQPDRDRVECWSSLATELAERVAVVALLRLKNERSLNSLARCVPLGIGQEPGRWSMRPLRGSMGRGQPS